MYKTKQKEAVILALKSHNGITAEGLLEYLNKDEKTVSKATLYRTLDNEANVQKVYNEGKSCYEYLYLNDKCDEHMHLKCQNCGKIVHLDCKQTAHFLKHLSNDHDFFISPLKQIIYGTCKECIEGGKLC